MRILVVEDEAALARELVLSLAAAGYAVDRAADALEADLAAHTGDYDAIVLDLGLPGRDGLSLLGEWRAAGIAAPVLILTARDSWHEKVRGIDGGADDYVAKPFRMEELLARIRALIRRARGIAQVQLSAGGIVLDVGAARVTVAGEPVRLTSHEFRVLSYLMHHAGRVISRAELTGHIYAQDFDRDSNTLEVFIARLRRKLGGSAIETVRGLGYRVAKGDR